MPLERLIARSVAKPWGVAVPRPWAQPSSDGTQIGELWYERSDGAIAGSSAMRREFVEMEPADLATALQWDASIGNCDDVAPAHAAGAERVG